MYAPGITGEDMCIFFKYSDSCTYGPAALRVESDDGDCQESKAMYLNRIMVGVWAENKEEKEEEEEEEVETMAVDSCS